MQVKPKSRLRLPIPKVCLITSSHAHMPLLICPFPCPSPGGPPQSQVLDDLPHSRSTQSSSLMTGKAYLDNFSSLTAGEGAAVLPLFADPQVCAGPAWAGTGESRLISPPSRQATRLPACLSTAGISYLAFLPPSHLLYKIVCARPGACRTL